jgi:hypothetical protein
MAGNLALARVLPTTAFAYVTLGIAIVQTASLLGPLGADGLARRGGLPATFGSLRRTAAASAAVGLLAAAAARLVYHLPAPLILAVLLGTFGGGLCAMATAHLQGAQRFGVSFLVNQSHLVALLVAVAIALVTRTQGAELPTLAFGTAFVLVAGIGWPVALAHAPAGAVKPERFTWSDAGAFLLIQAAASVLFQMDRLLVPRALGVNELALYSVLATVAGSPFRMLQMGVGYTTIPRLRTSPGATGRRAILRSEAALVFGVAFGAAAVFLPLTAPLIHVGLAGKYQVTLELVVAVVLMGLVRVLDGFANSTATALAVAGDLRRLGAFSWIACAVGVSGGFVGARFGLVGAIYGMALGWLTRAVLAGWLGLRYLTPEP